MADEDTNTELNLDVKLAAALGQAIMTGAVQTLITQAGAAAGGAVAGSSSAVATSARDYADVDNIAPIRATMARIIVDSAYNTDSHAKQAQTERDQRNGYANAAMGIAILRAASGGADLSEAKALIEAAKTLKT